ncbi:GNAT family N-acetyltransferase [Microbacterium sp. G2-8]|uniref:GNAT family N-acetyltransferase n=1 Tax=Microbacterium sp. G2-8 TaxID=2842454 RepID=UPI001C895B42|nr:GNAT family N-acetyltransferase [Microbacterium sp. G2-8]
MIELLNGSQALARDREIWGAYDAIFGDQPSFETFRDTMFARHAARDRFRLAAAHDGERMIGFAYGYYGADGQYYTESVREALGREAAGEWLPGAFEFVSFGVLSAHRRGGIGRALYRAVMTGVDGTALLSTWDDPADPAVRFYEREGWRRIGAHDKADGSRTMQIMGWRPATRAA